MATNTQKYTNNAVSNPTASVGVFDSSVTLTASDGALFPAVAAADADYFLITFTNTTETLHEIAKVTNRTGDVLTIQKAHEGTTGLARTTSDLISLRLTSGSIGLIQTDIEDVFSRMLSDQNGILTDDNGDVLTEE